MQTVMQIDDKLQLLIDIEDVSALTRLGQTSIYRKMNPKNKNFDPSFPRPVDAGVRVNLWRYDEIKSWVCNLSNRKSCISTAEAVQDERGSKWTIKRKRLQSLLSLHSKY